MDELGNDKEYPKDKIRELIRKHVGKYDNLRLKPDGEVVNTEADMKSMILRQGDLIADMIEVHGMSAEDAVNELLNMMDDIESVP